MPDGYLIPEPEKIKITLWNTRGRAVVIERMEEVKELLQKGFRKATEDVKPGEYNPIYDAGNEKKEIPKETVINLGENLNVIKC